MIIKHLQGGGYRLLLPPSMQCVARVALPAIRFAMNCLPFFLRYAEGVNDVGSIMVSDLQRSRRRATIVSKANISKWVIWVSYAFLLIDIEV